MTYPSGIQSWGLSSIGECLDAEDLLGAILEVDFDNNPIDFEVDYLFEINHMFVDVACGNISHMYVDFWCLSLYCPIQWTLIVLHSLSRTKR